MDGACSSISNGVILLLFSRFFLYSGQMSPNLWLALYSPNRKSHRKRVVTLIKSTFCPLIDHALCFMSRISLLICRLQQKKKCSPTFYSTVVRVFTFHVWSLLVWLLYTWEVGIKDVFFSFSIWIFIIMKTLLPALNGYLNLYQKSVGCICVFLFLDSLFCFQ